MFLIVSCSTTEDDTGNVCTTDCTTLSGKFVTLNNLPISDVKVYLKHRVPGGGIGGGGSTRKIVSTKTDKFGNYNRKFYINDNELGQTNGYFRVEIDDSALDVQKYIRTNNLIGGNSIDIGFVLSTITNRDTVIDNTFYIPKKAYIKVNLNNYVVQQAGDTFEVQTLYPFGIKDGYNEFLDSEYSTGFSGYGNWIATTTNNKLKVFVAEGEKNIIRINKIKNGIGSSEDFELIVPPNNTIELTYNF